MSLPVIYRCMLPFMAALVVGVPASAGEPLKPRTDCALVRGARISYKIDYLPEPFDVWPKELVRLNNLAWNFGHELEKGPHSVLAVQVLDSGISTDDLTLMRLTFEFDEDANNVTEKPVFPTITHDSYVFGSPAFTGVGSFYAGQDQLRSISLHTLSPERTDVLITGKVRLTQPEINSGRTYSKDIKIDCVAKILPLESFTPFQQY